jgi:hypothetical protein
LKLTGKSIIRNLPEVDSETEYRRYTLSSDNYENNCIYNGYFQSEEYFKNIREDILRIYRIKGKYEKLFENQYGDFFRDKTIVLHVRRMDYLSSGNEELGGLDISLPYEYYRKALDMVADLDSYQVIFIGDDLRWIRDNFQQKDNYFFLNNSPIIDFQLMMNADIIIISNSSFAWWAAYLNEKKKTVYAPKYWLGHRIKREYPSGIHNPEWQWIEF